jgi:hypothetical protein
MKIKSIDQFMAVFVAASVILLSSCKKEEDERVPPDLSFNMGVGYTFAEKTVLVDDSVIIGAIATRKEDDLKSFNISVLYDGALAANYFTYFMTAAETGYYAKELRIKTRSQTGTEKWIFSVTDKDGNITQKTITLTVQ